MNEKIKTIIAIAITIAVCASIIIGSFIWVNSFIGKEIGVKYKTGLLVEVVESGFSQYTLIFDDDSVLLVTAKGDKGNFGNYMNKTVTVRYFEEWGKTLIDIEILEGGS